jgi:hypothetical protein
MGRPQRRPVQKSIISAIALCVTAALSGCSAASPSAGPASPSVGPASPSARSGSPGTAHSAGDSSAFTVTGVHPVPPNGSQDTHAQTPHASCETATLSTDHALGVRVARGFALTGLSASADLLRHFLAGTGTEVRYRAGSLISKQARASAAFLAVASEVSAAIGSQLAAGRTRVRLSAAQLPTVAFESPGSQTSDLYWGFRGTQGLTVTGSGHRQNGRYVGTLTYVIRDSYGFPVNDTLAGFGPPMRYLQTVCGAPQHPGGARWFPDTITLTMPFSQPA